MHDVWVGIASVVFAVLAAWASRRVLGTRIGWLRAIVTGIVIFLATVPLARSALISADVLRGQGLAIDSPTAALFVALALGWQFAIVVMVILVLELLWPSGRGFHPVRAAREALRRRDRMRRYTQILRIASRHGLEEWGHRRRGEVQDVPAAVVAAMNEAGVTFVKVGQVLSTRDDVLPRAFTDAFATLQMQSTPLPWPAARQAIEAELQRPLEEVFAWVDETPLAAASVAQVHAARLLPSADDAHGAEADDARGAEVVIKIQRPDARASVETDVDIIERIAADAQRHAAWARGYGVRALAAEFVRTLREELDYRVEVANTELLRGTLARGHGETVAVPRIHRHLCTPRMIVQERIEGTPLARLNGGLPDQLGDRSDGDAHRTSDVILESVFEQIAVRGVFHADLHPGNVIIRPDGGVTLIDFGAIGTVERSLRRLLIALLLAMSSDDDVTTTDIVLMMVAPPAEGNELDRAALQHEIGVILTRMHNGPADAAVFRELIDVLRSHQLALPPALLLIFRTIASLEGTLRRLDPTYDIVKEALERAPRFAAMSVDPKQVLTDAQARLQVAAEQLRRLPRRLETLGARLEDGTFTVRVRSHEDPVERSWMTGLVGQLTTTLVGVALIVVAAVLLVAGGGPALTPDVDLLPFVGALVGLGGMMLLLRSLRQALSRREAPARR